MDPIIDPAVTTTVTTSVWEWACGFFGGRNTFLTCAAVLVGWIIITRTLRKVKDFVILAAGVLFNPMRFRRVLFNLVSLVFMVGGVASASAGRAKLNGSDGMLEAIVGGGAALALYGFVLLCFSNFQAMRKPHDELATKTT